MFLSGIDIGGTSIKFGIFDEQLNLLQQWSRPTPKEPAEAAALIAAQLEPYHVAAIGAGAPGTLNAVRETITADNLAWVDATKINALADAPAKPFAATQQEQLALAKKSLQTLDLTALDGCKDDVLAIFEQAHFGEPNRAQVLSDALAARCKFLKEDTLI